MADTEELFDNPLHPMWRHCFRQCPGQSLGFDLMNRYLKEKPKAIRVRARVALTLAAAMLRLSVMKRCLAAGDGLEWVPHV